MSQQRDEWMLIGRITGPRGVRGDVKVRLLTDFPERFDKLESVYLGPTQTPYIVRSVSRPHTAAAPRPGRGPNDGLIAMGFQDVSTRAEADALRGMDVWVPRAAAVRLPDGQHYRDEIIGLTVVSDQGELVGSVEDILETGANDVYVVRGAGREILIPAIHEVVKDIDVTAGRIVVHVMEGMLD